MMHLVSRDVNIPVADILGQSRFKGHVRARFLVAAIARSHGMGPCAIGRRINRDHTTITNALSRFPKVANEATMIVYRRYAGVHTHG